MKIIEALKQIKDLARKCEDIAGKIRQHCADLDYETPVYPDQKIQVTSWMHMYRDLCHEISRLKYLVQKTNVLVPVTITIGNNDVTKSIAEWIVRRREICNLEARSWANLGDRGLKDGKTQTPNGGIMEIKIRRYYDPVQRDNMLAILQAEPALINARLEIVNAVTDLME